VGPSGVPLIVTPESACEARVEVLDVERLEALAEALLDFRALADLQTWLEQDA
jgi:hypothetical protein